MKLAYFDYDGSSREVEVMREDNDYIEGLHCGQYKKFLKYRIYGEIEYALTQDEDIVAAPAYPTNRLNGARAYLSGAIEDAKDGEDITWRESVTEQLKAIGVKVCNPTKKVVKHQRSYDETLEKAGYFKSLRDSGQYDRLREEGKIIRNIDLRLVDVCDFIIVRLDETLKTCGTWEEGFLANREKKPVLVWYVQGKNKAPVWLFWTVPHEHIFSSEDELMDYVRAVDSGEADHDRWVLYDFEN